MTLMPTHLSLGAILFWTFIPASEKDLFRQKKHYFWVVIVFTLLPDFDIFIGIHRGIFHSIIVPMIMVIVGSLIYYNYQYLSQPSSDDQKKEELLKRSFIGRCVLYTGTLWLIHILLDLEYPLAIFYPLSDRLYQFNFEILFDLMPWFILPATIAGIGFEISGVSYLRGLTTYFVNLPPTIREEIYGTKPIAFSIDDFFVHLFLFVIFLLYVARPMAPTVKLSLLSEWRGKIRFDGPILGFGMILLVIGGVVGPMIGTHTIDSDSVRSSFQVSPTVFSPTIAIKFETTNYLLQPNTIFSLTGTLKTTSDDNPFDQILLLTTQQNYSTFSNAVSKLFKQYPFNTSDNILAFTTNYSIILNELITYPLAMNLTNLNETSLHTQLSSGSFTVVGVIERWNFTQILNGSHLLENTRLEVKITSSRFTLLIFGLGSIIAGIGVTILSVMVKKRK
ncbi:MAG: metal-dependent hydrolase [Candidatus Heimdallarchaeota archaeon]|nr:MAG: metal-dependent hydrolase [Candidatus Heimdallarchaeota archaeon]